ncbi:hypothetical protein RJ639_015166 [Escallonia herrerae]|uniref:PNO1 second type I KH domain-containing protein n=1 Tax=Escallonia herrerae TaxID=1293975 RepID=A0AA88VIZ8_9ASTE|nr:hypothetical protein RJ639_015166 [Escallonia herrerae]
MMQSNGGSTSEEILKVSVPPHRFGPLKQEWMEIYKVVFEQMKIDIRMNLKSDTVELRAKADTPDVSNLQRCAHFVGAFVLGFNVADANVLTLDDGICIESFECANFETPEGQTVYHGLTRLSDNEKIEIEMSTNTRIVIQGERLHILGSPANIEAARCNICKVIIGFEEEAPKISSEQRPSIVKWTDLICSLCSCLGLCSEK